MSVKSESVNPRDSVSNRGADFDDCGPEVLSLCRELLGVGFSHEHVKDMVVAVYGTSSVVGTSYASSERVSVTSSRATRDSVRQRRYFDNVDNMARTPGYCYLWLIRPGKRDATRSVLGPNPLLRDLFDCVQEDWFASARWSAVYVVPVGAHVYHLTDEYVDGSRTFAAAMAATLEEFGAVYPSYLKRLVGSLQKPAGKGFPVTAAVGGLPADLGGFHLPSTRSEVLEVERRVRTPGLGFSPPEFVGKQCLANFASRVSDMAGLVSLLSEIPGARADKYGAYGLKSCVSTASDGIALYLSGEYVQAPGLVPMTVRLPATRVVALRASADLMQHQIAPVFSDTVPMVRLVFPDSEWNSVACCLEIFGFYHGTFSSRCFGVPLGTPNVPKTLVSEWSHDAMAFLACVPVQSALRMLHSKGGTFVRVGEVCKCLPQVGREIFREAQSGDTSTAGSREVRVLLRNCEVRGGWRVSLSVPALEDFRSSERFSDHCVVGYSVLN